MGCQQFRDTFESLFDLVMVNEMEIRENLKNSLVRHRGFSFLVRVQENATLSDMSMRYHFSKVSVNRIDAHFFFLQKKTYAKKNH